MREITNPTDMIRNVVIRKNDTVIYMASTTKTNLQKVFNRTVDRAGGMWNGTDRFTVSIVDENNEIVK
jgi:hypothetical protein